MKTRSKALLLVLCAVLLVTASVLGTMAYLTSTDTVTNTFTVGKVAITLDEKDTDDSTPNAERDKANAYNLLPGHKYEKDPTVHVDKDSENSWLFVKVENGIAGIEAAAETSDNGYKKIETQITTNGWTKLENVDNVYYREYKPTTKPTANTDYVVFSEFKIADNANSDTTMETAWEAVTNTTTITVTAYAIQMDGFTTAAQAWTEVSK